MHNLAGVVFEIGMQCDFIIIQPSVSYYLSAPFALLYLESCAHTRNMLAPAFDDFYFTCKCCFFLFSAMKDLSAKMVQLKMEITRSGESSGQGGVSSEEHEAERLAEHGRLMEENTTLQTQLTSEKAERVALESKSTQQQKAYEHLLAQHNTLLSDHDMLKKEHESVHNTYDEEKREHNTLKTVHQELKSNYQNLQVKLDECKRGKLCPKY